MIYYLITDNNGAYIRKDISGKYVPIRSQACADRFESLIKARTVLKNAVPLKIRTRFSVIEIHEGEKGSPELDLGVSDVKVPKEEISEAYTLDFNYSLDDIEADLSRIIHYIKDSRKRNSELSACMSQIDRQKVDIEHYIEFNSFNACQGYKQLASLKDTLEMRRKIKDNFMVSRYAAEMPKDVVDSLVSMQSLIAGLKDRQYTPRTTDEIKIMEA